MAQLVRPNRCWQRYCRCTSWQPTRTPPPPPRFLRQAQVNVGGSTEPHESDIRNPDPPSDHQPEVGLLSTNMASGRGYLEDGSPFEAGAIQCEFPEFSSKLDCPFSESKPESRPKNLKGTAGNQPRKGCPTGSDAACAPAESPTVPKVKRN